jgi:hypothetical protein
MYPMERDVRIVPRRMRENRTTRNPVFPLGMATDILENMSLPVVKALKNPISVNADMGSVFILIPSVDPPRSSPAYDQLFRQVFWLPDQLTGHPFPSWISTVGLCGGHLPVTAAGPLLIFTGFPFDCTRQYLKQYLTIPACPARVKNKSMSKAGEPPEYIDISSKQ